MITERSERIGRVLAPRRGLRWGALAIVAVVVSAAPLVPATSDARPAVLPVSAITIGMTGIGKTVLLGTRVSEFQVRVLGVLKNGGPAGDLVLFRASGPELERVGGLAAGMSGSPIYLGGRLAGAFSYAFPASDPMIGMFTPIEDMLRDAPRGAAVPLGHTVAVAPFRVSGDTVRRIAFSAPGAPAPVAEPGTLVAVPAETPLFVFGLGAREQEGLARLLAPMGVVPMAGGSSADLPTSLPLEPGSAIGVALVRGDIGAYAIGTLTYRDGNRIVAFGHPFMNLGPSNYLLTNATVLQTVRGLERNIKVAAAGAAVGVVSEDRPAAVGGTIGVLPRVFGVRIQVTDADSGASRRFAFEVVPDRGLAPSLATLGAQEAIQRALNRSGAGTAEVQLSLRGRGLPKAISRDNQFYSANDIASRAIAEVPQAMRLVFNNEFADVVPSDMEMTVRVTGAQETAVIAAVQVAERQATPGQTVHVRVTVRPFRGPASVQEVALQVPADFAPGSAMLVVRAGGTPAPVTPGLNRGPDSLVVVPGPPRSLADAIAAFETQERHTDVVVDLVGGGLRWPGPGAAPSGSNRASATSTTPWVLDGRIQTPLVVTGGSR